MVSIPGLNLNFAGSGAVLLKYLAYVVYIIFISIFGFGIMYFTSFQIKAKIINLSGSTKKGSLAIGGSKNNRFKWVRNRTAWKPLYPLFNKIEIEPFDPEYIYPGNRVIVFKLGEKLSPGRYSVDIDGKDIKGEIVPVPYYIRNWQSLAHKRNEMDYASQNFWDQNKHIIYGAITVFICCATCLVTIYLLMKSVGPHTDALNNLASSISNFNVIPGK